MSDRDVAQALERAGAWRELAAGALADRPLAREDALANAPDPHRGSFRVPPVG